MRAAELPKCGQAGCGNLARSRRSLLCGRHERIRLDQRKIAKGDVCILPDCGNARRSSNGLCGSHAKMKNRRGTTQAWKPSLGMSKHLEGYRRTNHGGYIRLCKYLEDGSVDRVFEHRVVMEAKIGRSLLPEENVHHINGVRNDNRPENLEIWNTSQPSGQRVEDKVAWARHILELYVVD